VNFLERAAREEHFRRIGEFWLNAHESDAVVRALEKSVDYFHSFSSDESGELVAALSHVSDEHILRGKRHFPLSIGGKAEDVIYNRIKVALRQRIRDFGTGRG